VQILGGAEERIDQEQLREVVGHALFLERARLVVPEDAAVQLRGRADALHRGTAGVGGQDAADHADRSGPREGRGSLHRGGVADQGPVADEEPSVRHRGERPSARSLVAVEDALLEEDAPALREREDRSAVLRRRVPGEPAAPDQGRVMETAPRLLVQGPSPPGMAAVEPAVRQHQIGSPQIHCPTGPAGRVVHLAVLERAPLQAAHPPQQRDGPAGERVSAPHRDAADHRRPAEDGQPLVPVESRALQVDDARRQPLDRLDGERVPFHEQVAVSVPRVQGVREKNPCPRGGGRKGGGERRVRLARADDELILRAVHRGERAHPPALRAGAGRVEAQGEVAAGGIAEAGVGLDVPFKAELLEDRRRPVPSLVPPEVAAGEVRGGRRRHGERLAPEPAREDGPPEARARPGLKPESASGRSRVPVERAHLEADARTAR